MSARDRRHSPRQPSYVQLLTALPDRRRALSLAKVLVRERLAACVQIIGPVRSVYFWQGKEEQTSEWLCVIKSRRDRCPALLRTIRRLHPYEVPEVLVVPVLTGSREYLRWLDQAIDRVTD